jgi:uncharacterized protein GlcG (DUF336 family)
MLKSLIVLAFAASAMSAMAQMPIPYGPSVSLDVAKKVAQAAIDTAIKNKWRMAVAVVDTSGNLVYYEKMDDTQLSSALISQEKAQSATMFKRPTKVMQDTIAAGGAGLRTFRLHGAIPVDGGYPLISGGKIIGAVGVSGDASENDAVCARAGAETVK